MGTRTLGIKTKYTKRVVNWRIIIIKLFRHIVRTSSEFSQQLCFRFQSVHFFHVVEGSFWGGFTLSLSFASSRMRGYWAMLYLLMSVGCSSCCCWWLVLDSCGTRPETTRSLHKKERREEEDKSGLCVCANHFHNQCNALLCSTAPPSIRYLFALNWGYARNWLVVGGHPIKDFFLTDFALFLSLTPTPTNHRDRHAQARQICLSACKLSHWKPLYWPLKVRNKKQTQTYQKKLSGSSGHGVFEGDS